jgi:hypothetical protein
MVKAKNKVVKKSEGQKQEEQLRWILIVIGLVFLSFFSIYFYVQSLKYFEYANVNWEITNEGELTFYHSRMKVGDSTFYNNYFRFDPRENDIEVNVRDYTIEKKVWISNGDDYLTCKNAIISNSQLGQFFSAFDREVEGSVTNEEIAKDLNLTQIDCPNANIEQSVIILKKSEVPGIFQNETFPGCYMINVGDCKNVQSVERFLLGIIEEVSE